MKAIWNGAILAESNNTVVVEGNHYFPADAINKNTLQTVALTALVHGKGLLVTTVSKLMDKLTKMQLGIILALRKKLKISKVMLLSGKV